MNIIVLFDFVSKLKDNQLILLYFALLPSIPALGSDGIKLEGGTPM
jgi:hypothetical protein